MKNSPGVRFAALALLALALSACATKPPPATGQESPLPASVKVLGAQITEAAQLVDHDQYERADAKMQSAITARSFATQPAELRHAALQLAAAAALQVGDPKRALTLLKRSSEMKEADSDDGILRVIAGNAAHDRQEVAAALMLVATRWPDTLPQLEPGRELGRAMFSLEEVASESDRYAVLSALFDARLTEQHDDDSDWWRDLALLRLHRNDLDGARQALLRIKDPYVAISVECDKRYDPIRNQLDTWPGVASLAGRGVDTVLKRAQDTGELEYMVRLADLLGESLRFEHELQVTDTVIELVETAGAKAYDDYDDWYVWILNARAHALFGLGRWDAAISQERVASDLAENRGANVSQVINLAWMYALTGKPEESLSTLERLRPGSSSTYGDMQAQGVRVIAAVQLHDIAAVEGALAFMRQHPDTAAGTLEEALIAAGRDDEAAQLLISRLDDDHRRTEALQAVQEYGNGVRPTVESELHRHWKAIVDRADVQAAIARVGRTGHYPVMDSRNF